MKSLVENYKGIIRIILPEDFAVEEVTEFRNVVYELLNKETRDFIIDFNQCNYIDSTGLGVLVSVYKKCSELKGSLKLCSINPSVLKIFKLTRLDNVFEIYLSYQEAISNS